MSIYLLSLLTLAVENKSLDQVRHLIVCRCRCSTHGDRCRLSLHSTARDEAISPLYHAPPLIRAEVRIKIAPATTNPIQLLFLLKKCNRESSHRQVIDSQLMS